uniref:Solute carrier family 29 member 1a n=1 Tax=Oryzias sinensis TaxID=183150 RepID=A0A8C7X4R8_9TELE
MTAISAPRDKYNAVWIIFFILGLGTLLPWNFFMTATQYFTDRLKVEPVFSNLTANGMSNETAGEPGSPSLLELKFNNVMTLCAMVPLLIFTCLNSFIHQRIPQKLRISGSLTVILVVFMLTAVLVKVEMDPVPFFTFTMIKIVFINSFGAILQSSLFGLAGILPASYTTPIMSGQGLAGTFAAFSMICALASGSKLQDSAFGYFITACVVIAMAILAYFILPKMIKSRSNHLLNFFQWSFSYDNAVFSQNKKTGGVFEDVFSEQSGFGGPEVTGLTSWCLFDQIWVTALSVCFIFTVTIGTFPAVTADVKSAIAGEGEWNTYFIPVSCFLLFNLMDWAGRSLTALCMWPGKDSMWLPGLVGLRIIFFPLFMLCNVQPRHYLPVPFEHDAWYIIFMILFSFSNGYLASLCMCYGPKKVPSHQAETAGAIMAFFLSLGLALGAAISFALRAMV